MCVASAVCHYIAIPYTNVDIVVSRILVSFVASRGLCGGVSFLGIIAVVVTSHGLIGRGVKIVLVSELLV